MRLPDEPPDELIDLFDAMAAALPKLGFTFVQREHEWMWHINDQHAVAKCRHCETVRMWNGDELDINRLLNHQ